MQHIGAAETVTGILRRIAEAEKRGLSMISIEGAIVSGDFEYTFPGTNSAAAMRGTLRQVEKDPLACIR
jgi:hypothetical protein